MMKTLTGLLAAICLVCFSNANLLIPQKPKPVVYACQYKYKPVCGSDRVTYMNECILNCTRYMNPSKGSIFPIEECECRDECNCQPVDLPVCAKGPKGNIDYPNECELACENRKRIAKKQEIMTLQYRTACLGPIGPCPDIDTPVCGSNNMLYRNKCVLRFASYASEEKGLGPITVKNNGACVEGCLCPLTSQPVCGSDGNFYDNPCKLNCENIKRKYNKQPLIKEVNKIICEGCICTLEYNPVCGSDGITYSNPCMLNCEIKKQLNPQLKQLYRGECKKCKCRDNYDPVCGTDLKTYKNYCWWQCENIGKGKISPPFLYKGKCQTFSCDCTYCEDTYQPMCGTDNQTYLNLCWLKCNDKCKKKNEGSGVFLAKRGSC